MFKNNYEGLIYAQTYEIRIYNEFIYMYNSILI